MQKQNSNGQTQVALVYTWPNITNERTLVWQGAKLLKLYHKREQNIMAACTITPKHPTCITASNTHLWTHMHLSTMSTCSALLLIILFLVLALFWLWLFFIFILHLHTKREMLASREAGIMNEGAWRHRFSILIILVGEGGANYDNRFKNIRYITKVHY